MDKKSKLLLKKKLEVAELAGEKVMIDFESGKYFMLKGAANDIWDMLDKEIMVETIIDQLLKIYDIDEETCEQSVYSFIHELSEYKFIEIL